MKIKRPMIPVSLKIKQFCLRISLEVICLASIVLLLSCSSKVASDIPKDLIFNKKIPSVEAFNFQTFYTDSGVVRYFLKTPRLLIFDRENHPTKSFRKAFIFSNLTTIKKSSLSYRLITGRILKRRKNGWPPEMWSW